jgi:hypothetical protein
MGIFENSHIEGKKESLADRARYIFIVKSTIYIHVLSRLLVREQSRLNMPDKSI